MSSFYKKWIVRRPGHIYLARTWDPNKTNARGEYVRIENGYVGKTQRQKPRTRWNEHIRGTATAPPSAWADLVASWELLYSSKKVRGVTLAWLEWFYIRVYRPRYNYTFNLGNRRRIPKYEAENQREIRDLVRAELSG
jgi:hypothetical protein